MWLEDGRDMIDVFVKAGDLDKLTYFLKSALSLEVQHPEARPELAHLKNLIEEFRSKENLEEKFERLTKIGEEISEKTGPSREQMGKLLKIFSDKLKELGFKSINIYKIRNGRVSLLRQELAQSGFDPKKVNLSPEEGGIERVGGYGYVVMDKLDKDENPLKTILLRSQFTGKASREYEKYYNAIVW